MPNVGPFELAIVLIIALIVFGPKRLPELGKSLGKGIREFKGSINGEHDDEPPTQATPAPPPAEIASAEQPAEKPRADEQPAEKESEDEPVAHDRG
jgi:sec-independent protein translocase protein TatA